MARDGDVDVLGPKNALLRAFPIDDLGAQSLSSFQRSVGPVKPGIRVWWLLFRRFSGSLLWETQKATSEVLFTGVTILSDRGSCL